MGGKTNKILKGAFAGLVSAVLCLPLMAGCGGGAADYTNVIKLQDNQALLTNPDMGFNFTYYANTIYDFNNTLHPGDYLDDFPCDTVFFRIGWNWIEPEEGKFNWEFTDDIADEWIARGKNIAFCWVVTYPGDQSTPLWVRDAGAEGVQYAYTAESQTDGSVEYIMKPVMEDGTLGAGDQRFSNLPKDAQDYALNRGNRNDPAYNNGEEVTEGDYENYRGSWVVNYDDLVFLEKWENFLKAAGERYDDNPAVQFVEIGSFGDWGEGHNTNTRANSISQSTKRKHFELYLKYFENVQLMINDDAIEGTELVSFTKENGIGLSDHSVQVPYAGGPAEGMTGNVAYASLYWRDLPVLLEHHNGTTFMETYYNAIVDCHATFARINCDPYVASLSEWKDMIARKLGYRLVFSEVRTTDIYAGAEVQIQFDMTNEGSAPCYAGGNPTFYLVDSLGRVHATAVSEFNVRDLSVADRGEEAESMTGTAVLQIPDALIDDDYYICVSVVRDENTSYNLPLDYQDGTRQRYQIATFTVGVDE